MDLTPTHRNKRPDRHPLIVLFMTVGWSLVGTAVAISIMYIPGGLNLVDDYALGRATVRILLPSLLLMAGAGFCAGLKKYVLSIAITVFVFLACGALDAAILLRAQAARPTSSPAPATNVR